MDIKRPQERNPLDELAGGSMSESAARAFGGDMQPARPKGDHSWRQAAPTPAPTALQPPRPGVEVRDGLLILGPFAFSAIGVHPGDFAITQETWRDVRDMVMRWDDAAQWWIGDLLAYGQREWAEGYRQVAALTGKDVKTLRNYVYVAQKVEVSRRRDTLSFGHHQAVAPFDAESQTYWLDYAEQYELTVAELRKQMQGAPATKPAPMVDGTIKDNFAFLLALNGIPIDRAAREELRQRIILARTWLDNLEEEL